MITSDRFERELPVALTDIAAPGTPDYLTDILGRTARTRQRPAWASLERWLPMEITTPRASVARVPWRPMAAVALIALLLVAALALYAGSQRRVPPPFGPAANGVIPYALNGDTYLGDPVTGESRLILGGPDVDLNPGFSSDGTLVGVIRSVSAGLDSLVVFDQRGQGQRTINPEPLRNLGYAQWVPGRHEIIATHDVDGVQRLEVFDADGTPPRVLLEGASVDSAVYRPPLGDEIVFRGRIDGTWGLYTMRPDGTGVTRLAMAVFTELTGADPDQDLNAPAWSPDGSKIYYNHYDNRAGATQAWVMNADGSDAHRFNASGPPCCSWEGGQLPSPDGKWVLMNRSSSIGLGDGLTVFPADGSGDGKVVEVPHTGGADWAWSPDSAKILLSMYDAPDTGQGLIDPITGAFTRLPWDANSTPDWQRTAK
jgi:hypothetical protein